MPTANALHKADSGPSAPPPQHEPWVGSRAYSGPSRRDACTEPRPLAIPPMKTHCDTLERLVDAGLMEGLILSPVVDRRPARHRQL